MPTPTTFETCSAEYDYATDLAGFLNCSAVAAQANVQAVNDDLSGGLNQFFLIFGGALVFFMQIGFAMLCAGSIRAKNVRNVMLWNLLDSAGGGISYYCVGYAFAYGSDGNETVKTFVGTSQFFLAGSDINYSFFFFQWAFASALSSIVAGTIAERTKMIAYLDTPHFWLDSSIRWFPMHSGRPRDIWAFLLRNRYGVRVLLTLPDLVQFT